MTDEYLKGIMNRDAHNVRVLEQFRGVKPGPRTPETDADPANPNVSVIGADGISRGLQFSEGAFDRSADLSRIAELEAALKPFALAAADLHEGATDADHIWESPAAMNISAGDLRRAHAVIGDQQT